MKEKDLLGAALDLLRQHEVEYADLRFLEQESERIKVRNDRVEGVTHQSERGVGVRVLWKGAWGFACTPDVTEEEVIKAAEQALEVARAAAAVNRIRVLLAPNEVWVDTYRSPCKVDPFAVPLDEKLSHLFAAIAALRESPQVAVAEGAMEFTRTDKLFMSTEGAELDQHFTTCGAYISAVAREGDEVQRRSYPQHMTGNHAARGYEFINEMALKENAERVREEAVALLHAPTCPVGEYDLILGTAQLALQVHESCGHPTELDRVLGSEISLAGGSFLTPDKQGTFRYGSPQVRIMADATIPGALGSFGYDDEGVRARAVPLIDEGVFVGYLSSRETAAAMGTLGKDSMRSSGAMRAEGFNRPPIIRMVNINLEPGSISFDGLLADTEGGIFMDCNKSWSIDDLRLNFQFGCEVAWEVKGGKLGQLFKNPVYRGITPEFWSKCDAVCGKEHWHLWGVPHCGKGDPMQLMQVGHGCAPARFRKVSVGVKE